MRRGLTPIELLVVITLLLILTAVASAEPIEPKAIVDAALAAHEQRIRDTETQIETWRRKPKSRQRVTATKDLAAQLKQLKTNPKLQLEPLEGKIGSVGHFALKYVTVDHVLGKDEMIATAAYIIGYTSGGPAESRFLTGADAMPQFGEFPVLLRGVDTAKAADGQMFLAPRAWAITKNYTFQTTEGGTSTIVVAEPFDLAEVEKLWKEMTAKSKR